MTSAGVKTAAGVALIAAVALWWMASAPPSLPAPDAAASGPSVASLVPPPMLPAAPLPIGGPAGTAPAAIAAPFLPLPPVPLGSDEIPDLRADAQGQLVVDTHTRDELEKLLALNDRAAALALLRRLDGVLPPAAFRQAVDALYAYQSYGIAAAQIASPAQPVTDEAGAAQQLEALHALRVEQFGPAGAQAYFGDEEAIARRLLADMRARPGRGSTLDERAEQAQQTLSPTR